MSFAAAAALALALRAGTPPASSLTGSLTLIIFAWPLLSAGSGSLAFRSCSISAWHKHTSFYQKFENEFLDETKISNSHAMRSALFERIAMHLPLCKEYAKNVLGSLGYTAMGFGVERRLQEGLSPESLVCFSAARGSAERGDSEARFRVWLALLF